jgi:hypothetical protein
VGVLAVCSSPYHASRGRGEHAREKKPQRGLLEPRGWPSSTARDAPSDANVRKHTTALTGGHPTAPRVSLRTAANPRESTLSVEQGALRRAA